MSIKLVGMPINRLTIDTNPNEIKIGNVAKYTDPRMSGCPVIGEIRLIIARGTVKAKGNALAAMVPINIDFMNLHMIELFAEPN
nr:hypothetical protein [Novosphingobium panipatense]